MNRHLSMALILVLTSGCTLDSREQYESFLDKVNGTGTGGEDDGDESSSGYGPVNTVTTVSPDEPPDRPPDANDVDDGPRVLSFTASPANLFEAGPVELLIEYTPDVAAVMVFDDYEGETHLLAELDPGTSVWEFAVTSEEDYEGDHELHAIVVDDEDRWAEAITDLSVDLPPGGSLVWVNDGKDDTNAFQYARASTANDAGVFVVIHDYNAGDAPSAVRHYAAHGGDLEWEYTPPLDVTLAAIEFTQAGDLVVVGYSSNDEVRRMWVHQLDAESGEPTWLEPREWIAGTEATAVAVAPNGDIVVGGVELAEEMFVDIARAHVWRIPANLDNGFTSSSWHPEINEQPYVIISNVAVSETGRVLLVGWMADALNNQMDEIERGIVLEFDESLEKLLMIEGAELEANRLTDIAFFEESVAVAGWRRTLPNPDNPNYGFIKILEDDNEGTLTESWTFEAGEGQPAWMSTDVNSRLVMVSSDSKSIRTHALTPDAGTIWSTAYEHAYANVSGMSGATDRWGNVYFCGALSSDQGLNSAVGKLRP